jgi:ribosomal protein L37E
LVGAAAGGIGRQKVLITCLKCGHRFKSGEQLRSTAHEERIKGVWVGDTEIRQPYKCHHCGKISSASVSERNCPACGTPYSPKDLIHTPTQKEINETNGCLAIFIAVLCILLIVLFVLLIQKCS